MRRVLFISLKNLQKSLITGWKLLRKAICISLYNQGSVSFCQSSISFVSDDSAAVKGSGLDTLACFRSHFWGKNRIQADKKTALEIIDLSLVNLPQLNLCSTKIILVRKEYRLAYDAILTAISRKAGIHRSVFLITGHPGIGV